MLTLEKILRMAAQIDEMASEVHVSPAIWNELKGHMSETAPTTGLFGVNVVLDTFYGPSWWSEHYRDKIVLHTEKGTTTFPGIGIRFKPFGLGNFEIEVPKNWKEGKIMVEKTLGQIGYEAYCKFTDNKSLISGAPLPPFAELKTPIQEAWEKAGQAVAASVGRGGEITGKVEDVSRMAPGEPEAGPTQK